MIQVAKPFLGEEEAAEVREVILSGWVTQGPKVKEFEDAFASYVGAPHASAVSSCTTALHLALLAAGVKPGDVVVTVSHSFIATANSVRHCGAEPVFVDIDPETYNISPAGLDRFLAEDCVRRDGGLYFRRARELARGGSPLRQCGGSIGRVAAVLAVHQMGMPCDLPSLLPVARTAGVPLIEDAACAVGSEVSIDGGASWEKVGRPHGEVACFSFHPRKVLTTGDGGMLTTRSEALDREIRLLRVHGMSVSDAARHASGTVVFEEYPVTGYNYRMTDIQAAVGLVQLRKLDAMVTRRRQLGALYRQLLGGIAWLGLPVVPAYASPNWQSYPVRILPEAPLSRNDLMQRLLDQGVSTRPGVMNAHEEPPYRFGLFPLPQSERARREAMILPMFHTLSEDDMRRIAELLGNV